MMLKPRLVASAWLRARSLFCDMVLGVLSSLAIILLRKRELASLWLSIFYNIKWASTRENRKPVIGGLRLTKSQTNQRLCYSFFLESFGTSKILFF